MVSDGIGGHRAGEVAAELAVNYISQKVSESNGQKPLEIIELAIETASEAIAARSASKDDQQGMGATCVCAWIVEDKLYTGYVGDSRNIYLIRDEKIRRLRLTIPGCRKRSRKASSRPMKRAIIKRACHSTTSRFGRITRRGFSFMSQAGRSADEAKKIKELGFSAAMCCCFARMD